VAIVAEIGSADYKVLLVGIKYPSWREPDNFVNRGTPGPGPGPGPGSWKYSRPASRFQRPAGSWARRVRCTAAAIHIL